MASTSQQSGWGGLTSSTASGRSSPAKSSNIIFQTPYNMETSKNSTRQLTLDELISSQEGSPANPTQSQESDSERKTSATCGQRCCALFESVHPVGSWARTFAGLLVGMEGWSSRRCALTWKLVGTPYNRLYFLLQVSHLAPTEETESGLLPTPRTVDVEGGAVSNVKNDGKGWYRENAKGERWGVKLRDVVESGMLPTPNAFDWNTARSPEALAEAKAKYGSTLQDTLRQRAGQGSQLSPLFVEEMMGFPKNWTASPFQSGDENQSKPTGTP